MASFATGLGLDAGGTRTRWAVVSRDGAVLGEGAVGSISGLQMNDEAGRMAVARTLAELAQQVQAVSPVQCVCAGVTGLGGPNEQSALVLQQVLAQALQLEANVVQVRNDMEVAYHDVFAPGAGFLVYAGTGSIAAFVDETGVFHRAGGRGSLLDDGGSGFWIAREALRQIWRAEDERPLAWQASPMAQRVFETLGGSDWALTRQFVYAGTRGAMGELALAVAAAADTDPAALAILRQAGVELARLGSALASRFGPRAVALGGRAALLHPSIVLAMRAALSPELSLQVVNIQGHVAAARMALNDSVATTT